MQAQCLACELLFDGLNNIVHTANVRIHDPFVLLVLLDKFESQHTDESNVTNLSAFVIV